jgi:predicted Zn-dependent peptidase
MQISMAPAVEVCAPAVARVLEMLTELTDGGLEQEEFEFTCSYLRGSAAFSRATANQRLFRKLQEEVYGLPTGYGDGFPERLKKLERGAVDAAIARHFRPADLCVVVVATAERVQSALEAIGFDSVEVVDYRSY